MLLTAVGLTVDFTVGLTVGFTAAFVFTVGFTVGFMATIFFGMVGFIVGFGVDFMAAFAFVVRSDMIAFIDGAGFFVTTGVLFAFCFTLSVVPLAGVLATARPATRMDPINTIAMANAANFIAKFPLDNPITCKKALFRRIYGLLIITLTKSILNDTFRVARAPGTK